MNQPEGNSDVSLLLTGVLLALLALQKQRCGTMKDIAVLIDFDDAKTTAACHQAGLHLLRQQMETAREIQKLLEALAPMTWPSAGGKDGFTE